MRREFRAEREFPQAEFTSAEDFKENRAPAERSSVGNGMTDPFAVQKFEELFIPMGWTVK